FFVGKTEKTPSAGLLGQSKAKRRAKTPHFVWQWWPGRYMAFPEPKFFNPLSFIVGNSGDINKT
ncbi:hypothetical protein Dimus_031798, partial [Dionaea muscipula]